MSYQVSCACGKTHTLTAADAGMTFRCQCGKTFDVPPLHQLRTASGEAAVSPLVHLRTMLRNGQLPGTQECVGCQRQTNNAIRVEIECERVPVRERSHAEVVGCLLAPCIGWFVALV